MMIDVKKLARDNKITVPDLITRPVGRSFFDAVLKKLQIVSDGETLLLDFKDIKVIDSSFIDESIVRLIMQSREKERPFFIKLKNISQISEINIDLVFNSYASYNNLKIAVITDDIRMNNHFYIGYLDRTETDIIEYLRKNKRASIEELAALTGQDINSAAKTVDILYAARTLKKDGMICEAV